MVNPDRDVYRVREASRSLRAALSALPVDVLSGLRQSGKSTLLTGEPDFAQRPYRTLDDFATLAEATRSPESLLGTPKAPVTIDEVQRCPPLLTAIKMAVDRARFRAARRESRRPQAARDVPRFRCR